MQLAWRRCSSVTARSPPKPSPPRRRARGGPARRDRRPWGRLFQPRSTTARSNPGTRGVGYEIGILIQRKRHIQILHCAPGPSRERALARRPRRWSRRCGRCRWRRGTFRATQPPRTEGGGPKPFTDSGRLAGPNIARACSSLSRAAGPIRGGGGGGGGGRRGGGGRGGGGGGMLRGRRGDVVEEKESFSMRFITGQHLVKD